ncbi:hypothetical protein [Priestia koreensis]|uniref:hypothetical protein n=1 Tax=Priestia koreensis TaxID=284581 RepID=UPI00203E459A|nr:hypothetical protein [Priestia koreensis]MCM3002935.1 hypothetical protein [Priestia koreensis]
MQSFYMIGIQVFLILGIIGIIVSGLLLETWTSEPGKRVNVHAETIPYAAVRSKIALYAGLSGLGSLILATFIYLLHR